MELDKAVADAALQLHISHSYPDTLTEPELVGLPELARDAT